MYLLPSDGDNLPYLPLTDDEWHNYQHRDMQAVCSFAEETIDHVDEIFHKYYIELNQIYDSVKPRRRTPLVPHLAKWYFTRVALAISLDGMQDIMGRDPRYQDRVNQEKTLKYWIRTCCVVCWQLAVKVEEPMEVPFRDIVKVLPELRLDKAYLNDREVAVCNLLGHRLNAPFIKENGIPFSSEEESKQSSPQLSCDDLMCEENMDLSG